MTQDSLGKRKVDYIMMINDDKIKQQGREYHKDLPTKMPDLDKPIDQLKKEGVASESEEDVVQDPTKTNGIPGQ